MATLGATRGDSDTTCPTSTSVWCQKRLAAGTAPLPGLLLLLLLLPVCYPHVWSLTLHQLRDNACAVAHAQNASHPSAAHSLNLCEAVQLIGLRCHGRAHVH